MKKIYFLLLTIITLNVFSQNLTLDTSFGNNGIFLMNENSKLWDVSNIIENADGSIILSTARINGANPVENIVVKLSANGTVDTSFGTNGYQVINVSIDNGLAIKKQADGKLILFGGQNNSKIIRLLPNGQLDSTFGINGEVILSGVTADNNYAGNTIIFQNDKILVLRRMNLTSDRVITRYNNDGAIDTTFGVNGFINNINSRHIFLDSTGNIVGISGNSNVYKIEKFDSMGQIINSFGTNGVLQVNIPFAFDEVLFAYMDNQNKILVSSAGDNEANSVFRINADGTIDTTFTYNFNLFYPAIAAFQQNGTSYYLGGAKIDANGDSLNLYLSKINDTGSVDTTFNSTGYYLESNSNIKSAQRIIFNTNNILVSGQYDDGTNQKVFVAKYIFSTLSTQEVVKTKLIQFENPIKDELKISTKEEIKSMKLYNLEGKLVKISLSKNVNVSDLKSGIYVLKIELKNDEIITKKIIKY